MYTNIKVYNSAVSQNSQTVFVYLYWFKKNMYLKRCWNPLMDILFLRGILFDISQSSTRPSKIYHIAIYLFNFEKVSVFLFLMLSAKQGNYLVTFLTALVWRLPWPGIEPGTSRTRSQHSTTRLLRKLSLVYVCLTWSLNVSSFIGQLLSIYCTISVTVSKYCLSKALCSNGWPSPIHL